MKFHEKGSGFPVVLVHGFPVDSRMWNAVANALSATCRVIAPDLPGFGESAGAHPFTIESLADDLFDQLQENDATPCVLAGFSMGGYIALSFAARHPEALRGLILIDTRAEAETLDGRRGREDMIRIARLNGSAAIADRMVPKQLATSTRATQPEIVEELRMIMESCTPEAIENALAAMRDRVDRSADLGSIAVPTLILVGADDAITPPSTAEMMSQRIPGSVLEVIPSAGHMTPMEQPAKVSRAIENWLQSAF